jgi:hypothetical protein
MLRKIKQIAILTEHDALCWLSEKQRGPGATEALLYIAMTKNTVQKSKVAVFFTVRVQFRQ